MKLKLISKTPEAGDVITFRFQADQTINWQPGQYFHYVLQHQEADDRGTERWFTIASAPYESYVQVSTRMAGERASTFKRVLDKLEIGEEIEADGPEGDFVLESADTNVFIAGGIGITPFRSMVLEAAHKSQPLHATLLYGNRSEDTIAFRAELEEVAKQDQTFKINYILEPEKIDEATIRKYVGDLQKPHFYVSGPEPMVEALDATLKGMGVPEDHIHNDFFPGYDWPLK